MFEQKKYEFNQPTFLFVKALFMSTFQEEIVVRIMLLDFLDLTTAIKTTYGVVGGEIRVQRSQNCSYFHSKLYLCFYTSFVNEE